MTTANQSIQQSEEIQDDFKTGYALIVIAVVIVIGNSLVLLTVKSFERRLVADVFISSLALLDIIHTVTSVLLAITFKWTSLHHDKSRQTEFRVLCKVQAWLTVTTQAQSAFIVTVINLERLLAVSRPFFYKSYATTHRAVKTLLILLLISICISSLPLIGWGNYVLLPKMALCLFPHDSDYAIFIVVIGYADLLLVSYCFLAVKVSLKKFMKRQARFAARRGAIVELQARGVDAPPKITSKTASLSIIQSQRLLKVTAMVSALFYFSWLPLMVSITRAQVTREPNHVLLLISTLQPLASPLANPLIYFLSWERYKKSYIKIVKRLMRCKVKSNEATTVSKGASPTTSPSAENFAGEFNQAKDENKTTDRQQFNKGLPQTCKGGSQEMPRRNNLPTIGGKLRSYSCNNSMPWRSLTSSLEETGYHTEAKRRYTVGGFSESIVVESELLSGENIRGKSRHTRTKNLSKHEAMTHINEHLHGARSFEDELPSTNVLNKHRLQYKQSFNSEKRKKKSRKLSKKSWFKIPQTGSFEKDENEKTTNEYFGANNGDNVMESKPDEEASVKDDFTLKSYSPNRSVVENKNTERNDSENLPDKCLITERISQYLSNVMSDQDVQISHKCKSSEKLPENTKKKWNSSGEISQKLREYSTSKHHDRRNPNRQRPRQLYSRNRHKYSRKNYSEEFEDFRKKLDDDKKCSNDRNFSNSKDIAKSSENYKEEVSEKVEDEEHFRESFDEHRRGIICTKEKGKISEKRSDEFIHRIFPKITNEARKKRSASSFRREYRRYGNKSTKNRHQDFQGDSKRRKNSQTRREVKKDAAARSKDREASIWTFL